MADSTKSGRNNFPERRSQGMALIMSLLLWCGAVVAAFLMPKDLLERAGEPVYQSISLRLSSAAVGTRAGGSVTGENSSVRESPLPALEPDSTASVSAPLSTPPESVSAASASFPPQEEAVPIPESKPPLAGEKPVLSAPSSRPAPDVEALDQAEWESLFAQGSGRAYSNSAIPPDQEAQPTVTDSTLSGMAAPVHTLPSSTGATSRSATPRYSLSAPGTEEALEKIVHAAEGGELQGGRRAGMEAESAGESGSGSGIAAGATMELMDGSFRRLLEPAEPSIRISPENQRYIPGSLEVTITFEITPEGLVLPGSVRITPESLVPGQVQAEVKAQIGKWRFQVAEGSGQVRFKYNIMKK